MPLATRASKLDRLSAHSKGIVNALPRKLKFVLTGETFAFTRSSPTVICHHGLNKDTIINTIIVTPPARPNQFILTCMFFTCLCYWNVRNPNAIIHLDVDSLDVDGQPHQVDVDTFSPCVGTLKVSYGIFCPCASDSYHRRFACADRDRFAKGSMA